MRLNLATYAAATLVAVLSLTGCAPAKTELPPQVTQSLTDLRDQLVQGKALVQTTSNSARDLTQRPQADVKTQVDRLNQAITSLENLATNNRQQFANAEERAKAYFEHWNSELQGMSTSLQTAGEERREKSIRSFNELKTRTEALRVEFRPFLSSLKEIQKYLTTDTTAAGVKAVSPQIKQTIDREASILAKADRVIEQIDAMRGGK